MVLALRTHFYKTIDKTMMKINVLSKETIFVGLQDLGMQIYSEKYNVTAIPNYVRMNLNIFQM